MAQLSASFRFRCRPDLLSELTLRARRDGVTVGELARRALDDYLRRARDEERPGGQALGAPTTTQPSEAERVLAQR